ncbi:MAG: HlyD family efflux transporter periplasmic adaptor subunit [Eubacteriales bacterium]|nr:HlyD family efflux transporter periplasmic adaptor subunit [Eubacteriales bacterium]
MERRRRIRPAFYVMVITVLAVIGAVLFLILSGGNGGELRAQAMHMTFDASAVVIRDEATVTTEKYDKILYDVAEGAHVENGTQIAQVFKWGYQEDIMQSLIKVRQDILTYQKQLIEGIVNTDLDALELAIQQKQLAIRASIQGDAGADDLLILEQELKTLLEQRMTLLREVQADATLNDLYEQETVQLSNLATWKRDIVNNNGAGVVSFYFDGYEQAVSAQKMDTLNADLITSIINSRGVISASDAATESQLFRLIQNEHFYIAFLTDASSPFRLAAGEQYSVKFTGYDGETYAGTALAPIVSTSKIVNVLEFRQDMKDLIGIRLVNVTIDHDASGLEVPLKVLEIRDGLPGINVEGDGVKRWIQVDVLAADADNAIVKAANGGDTLVAGLRYVKP